MHKSDVPVTFGLDIRSQTKVRVCMESKNPKWPGSHFKSNITENQYAYVHGHKQHVCEIETPKQT